MIQEIEIDLIKMEQKGDNSLIKFLIKSIKNSKKKELTYNELLKFTENNDYILIQNFLCTLQGSHCLSLLDRIFENDNPNLKNCDYSFSNIKKKDNKLPSKELIKELNYFLDFNEKEFIKDKIAEYKEFDSKHK